jgi:Zn-dependent protease
LLAIHEFGHYFGARLVGVQARTPIFLGLLGAATIVDRQRLDPGRDAVITLGGPAAGLTVAAVCLTASIAAPPPWHTVLVALARGGFILNLLQLFPVLPLDGGHVAASLHRGWLMAGLLLQLAFVVFLLRSPGENVVAIAFVALTIGATIWMFRRDQPQRAAASSRGLVAAAYMATIAIGAGGLVAGFVVPFRAPSQVLGSQIIGDGFTATMPEGWDPRSVCCDEVLGLIHHYQTGAHTAIDVYDLRGGFGLADPRASSPTAIAQAELATQLQQSDSSALQPIEPIDRPGLEGVQFTYACACEGGYPGELFTSDVVILQHGSRIVSITLETYTQEYDGDHASLQQLVDGWSWTTSG